MEGNKWKGKKERKKEQGKNEVPIPTKFCHGK